MRKAIAIAVVVVCALVAGPAALADTQLLANGTFEGSGSGSLSGWRSQNATLTLVAGDGGVGFGAQQAWNGAGTTYGITTNPNPVVSNSVAGAVYTATGRFNAPSGKSVCLKVKETGAQSKTTTACTTGNDTWKDLPQIAYTALADNDTLNVTVIQKTPLGGDAFVIDNMSLTSPAVSTIDPPSNLSATAISENEIDLSWDASTTAGITGYHVYRNGNGTPIATVNDPDTTYADTTVNAGTFYTYTVTAFDATDESDPSNEASATTPGGGGSVTIAAAGDIACNVNDPDFNGGDGTGGVTGHCQQKAVANLIAQGSYSRLLAIGDLQYDCGSLGAFGTSYDLSWGQFNSIVAPVLGNHEVQSASDSGETGCSKKATGYFSYFANHGVTEAAGVGGKGYYSFDLGSWHIIALNAQCNQFGGCATGNPEEVWLRNDLAAHQNQCTLAFWHQAPWSTTGGGVTNTRTFWTDLVNANTELVLNGHWHHYERFADMNSSGHAVADGTGTREIVVGTGGESQGGFGSTTPAPGSQVRASGFGILSLTLNSGSYSWQYKRIDGTTGDSGSDTCH